MYDPVVILSPETLGVGDRPFIDRPPNQAEMKRFRDWMRVFCAGWGGGKYGMCPYGKDFEKAITDMNGGRGNGGKKILFDTAVPEKEAPKILYGLSDKSAVIKGNSITDDGIRDFCEYTNANATMWKRLKEQGIEKSHYGQEDYADRFGKTVVRVIREEIDRAVEHYAKDGYTVDKNNSVCVIVRYSVSKDFRTTNYILRSYDLVFPDDIDWTFKGKRLVGVQRSRPDAPLFEWYGGGSGGQLKWHPPYDTARHVSDMITVHTRFHISVDEMIELLDKKEQAASAA